MADSSRYEYMLCRTTPLAQSSRLRALVLPDGDDEVVHAPCYFELSM